VHSERRGGSRQPWFVSPDDLASTLAATTGAALRGDDLTEVPSLRSRLGFGRFAGRRSEETSAIAVDRLAELDAEAAADWFVEQYGPGPYPGVVCGSPHGAAAHLAALLGAIWLPSGFEVRVHWPEGSPADADGVITHGQAVSRIITANNPGLRVRQVHDPVTNGTAAGERISLALHWTRLPQAYVRLLASGLGPDPYVILMRDERRWPVLREADFSIQFGSAASDLTFDEYLGGRDLAAIFAHDLAAEWPAAQDWLDLTEWGVDPDFQADLRTAAGVAGAAYHCLADSDPHALSAAVADLQREWLIAAGQAGDHALVTTGRLVDPGQTTAKGLVPYWCENATAAAVSGAELWLATSRPFAVVHALPEPPGAAWSRVGPAGQWESVAMFATRCGVVDPTIKRAYPDRILGPRHASAALRAIPSARPAPSRLPVETALRGIRAAAGHHLGLDPAT
jgi:hypothetical protein